MVSCAVQNKRSRSPLPSSRQAPPGRKPPSPTPVDDVPEGVGDLPPSEAPLASEPPSSTPRREGARPPFPWPRGLVVGGLLAANLVVAYFVARRDRPLLATQVASFPVSAMPPSPPAPSASAVPEASPGAAARASVGPWGDLEVVEAEIALRDEVVTPDECASEIPAWGFAGHGKANVLRLVTSLGLDRPLEAALARTLDCTPARDGSRPSQASCSLRPDLAVVGALSPAARALVAAALASGQGLQPHRPVRRSRAAAERWVTGIPVAPAVRAQIRALLVPLGDDLVFFDRALVCSRLAEPADKVALVRAVAAAPALLVRLRVPERADVGALSSYWGAGDRREEVSALLASMASASGGGAIDVARLLPAFPRAHALAYPSSNDPPWDATASALAFFGKADDRPQDPADARKALDRDYRLVPREAGRLGDLVEVTAAGGGPAVTHAVLVADDIVFAKLRPTKRAPWLFLRLADLVTAHLGEGRPEVTLLRRRDAR